MFQIKDLTASVLPGGGMLLGPNCRISATDPGVPGCVPRTTRPRPHGKTPSPPHPPTPDPPFQKPSALCDDDRGHERDRGPRRAAGLEELRRELRQTLLS